MKMATLINTIKTTSECIVYPPSGLPTTDNDYLLPDDLLDFYALCGGVTFYEHSAYSVRIVSPRDFVRANPVILIELPEDQLASTVYEATKSWYIIGDANNGDYITIDLNSERLGRCYQSFWDSYAMEGDSPIIATSFTDLLIRLLANRGQHWYWLDPRSGFVSLGDAYD